MKSVKVDSREGLAEFIRSLAEDNEQNGSEWQNVTVKDFLTAASRWLDAAPSWARNMTQARLAGYDSAPEPPDVEQPTWELFARILRAARVYE